MHGGGGKNTFFFKEEKLGYELGVPVDFARMNYTYNLCSPSSYWKC